MKTGYTKNDPAVRDKVRDTNSLKLHNTSDTEVHSNKRTLSYTRTPKQRIGYGEYKRPLKGT